jgi:predicted nucleic acid-binding protein
MGYNISERGTEVTLDAGPPPNDLDEERIGEWMHTNSGKRFFPRDPRAEDICIDDIANGLALDCRYAGQGRIDRFYSVAEHCYHVSTYAWTVDRAGAAVAMAVLLHDAPEAYLNDLSRAVKHSIGCGYDILDEEIQRIINKKYNCEQTAIHHAAYIKELDCRIVPHEKEAIMANPQPWAYDKYQPLDGVVIYCFDPATAKRKFLSQYAILCDAMGLEQEEYEV